MKTPAPLILASTSPRRRELMAGRGYVFTIESPGIEETMPPHLTVRESVLMNARRKGSAAAELNPAACVVAADTLVALDGFALGKPANLADARRMLRGLSGRAHHVHSGVWVEHRDGGWLTGFVETSQVFFREISAEEIDEYLEAVDVLDKAGAYAAQHDPIGLIERIEGSRTNVIGLPMERLEEVLAGRGYEVGVGAVGWISGMAR